MQDRLSGLDGLRGIAASAVLVCHIAAAFCFVHGGNVPQWLASGKFGVQVFFVLSGFVILMTIERCASPGTFLASRFARLFPAYWAAIAIAAALGLWCPGEFPNVSSKLVAANFTMLQRFLGLPPLDWSYWTLPCELVFYFGMLMALWGGGLRHLERFSLIWISMALFFASIATHTGENYAQFFAIGISLYRFFRGEATLVSYAVIVAALVLCAFGNSPAPYDAEPIVYCCVGVFATGAVWIAATRPPRFLTSRPMLFLGAISYPLYLVHFRLSYVAIASLQDLPAAVSVAAAAALSIAAATLIHKLVERPGSRFFRRVLTGIPRHAFLSQAPDREFTPALSNPEFAKAPPAR